jgi:hypothetical protein
MTSPHATQIVLASRPATPRASLENFRLETIPMPVPGGWAQLRQGAGAARLGRRRVAHATRHAARGSNQSAARRHPGRAHRAPLCLLALERGGIAELEAGNRIRLDGAPRPAQAGVRAT